MMKYLNMRMQRFSELKETRSFCFGSFGISVAPSGVKIAMRGEVRVECGVLKKCSRFIDVCDFNYILVGRSRLQHFLSNTSERYAMT